MRRSISLIAFVIAMTAMAASALPAQAAPARSASAPLITWVRCWPPAQCTDRTTVRRNGSVRVAGNGFASGMTVTFAGGRGAGDDRNAPQVRVINDRRAVVRVPADAASGPLVVTVAGRRSGPSVPLTVTAAKGFDQDDQQGAGDQEPSPFDGDGMWIWLVSAANGGNVSSIISRAKSAGIETLYIKSADGSRSFSQFSPRLVKALKAGGLNVCAWHYVYGSQPLTEAARSAEAKTKGADCFVIDAEAEYEGRYKQAAAYIKELRRRVGPDYPIGLTSFPYVHYHPSFPYSQFFAPGGATYNLPQMYWKDIGTSVDRIFNITYTQNRVYGHPIFPLGQLYNGPNPADVRRFRQRATQYGATGLSWWSWQHGRATDWAAVSGSAGPVPTGEPTYSWPVLRVGSRGDHVVWAQMHLNGAGYRVLVNGRYGPSTQAAVRRFQQAKGLAVTGTIDGDTWPTLIKQRAALVSWR
jgi:hypothetical protein